MRFCTFATACVAVVSYPDIALAAPLPTLSGAPHQYPADIFAQNELDLEAHTHAHTELEGIFDWMTDIYEYFVPPKSQFFDVKEGELGHPKFKEGRVLQDEL